MKKQIVAAAVLMALGTGAAMAQAAKEGPWMVRVRAVNLDMANKNGTVVPDVTVNNKTIPEVDISYFLDKNIAFELVLTVPQKQDVRVAGNTIGTFKHLPPTFLVQYHWDMGGFKPYVGAGVNFTKISSVNLPAPLSLDGHSTGLALQAGVDVPLGNGMYFNFDVKKVQIRSDVYSAGVSLGTLKLDPVLVGVGLGWRF
jgi:outer membrane protein